MKREILRRGILHLIVVIPLLILFGYMFIMSYPEANISGKMLFGNEELRLYYQYLGMNFGKEFFKLMWKILPVIPILFCIEIFIIKDEKNKYRLCNLTCILNVVIMLVSMSVLTIFTHLIYFATVLTACIVFLTLALLIINVISYRKEAKANDMKAQHNFMPNIMVIVVVWLLWLILHIVFLLRSMDVDYYHEYSRKAYTDCIENLGVHSSEELRNHKAAHIKILFVNECNVEANTYTLEDMIEDLEKVEKREGSVEHLERFNTDYAELQRKWGPVPFEEVFCKELYENHLDDDLTMIKTEDIARMVQDLYEDGMNNREYDISDVIPDYAVKIPYIEVAGKIVFYDENTTLSSNDVNSSLMGMSYEKMIDMLGIQQKLISEEELYLYSVKEDTIAAIRMNHYGYVEEIVVYYLDGTSESVD